MRSERLKAVGLAAVTLITVGGIARRARRRGRQRRASAATGLARYPRQRRALAFSADEHQFLSTASAQLSSTLDFDETLQRVASLTASFLGDWSVVYLHETGGAGARVKAAHANPRLAGLVSRLSERSVDLPAIASEAVESQQPVLIRAARPGDVIASASGPEHLAIVKQLGVRSAIAVPLIAREAPIGAVVVVTSARSTLGERLVPLAEELASRAAAAILNAQLYAEARAAIDARDEILAVVAHDLRSPLHVIEFAAERLRREVPGLPRRAADRSLDWIVHSAQRATSLVRDLLDRARFDRHLAQLAPAPVDAADLIGEGLRRGEPLAALSSVALRIDVPPKVPSVRGDRERLLQVLENLIGNAIKFTPAGGSVTVGAREHEDGVRFFVSDTGVGIDPDDLERIFDRFWQARGADTRGAGLGLSICKRIIEVHGGRVWVESRVGEGTTVSFTLPRTS